MKLVAIAGAALAGSMLSIAHVAAHPAYIEESAALTPPANGVTYSRFGFQAAMNGEYALVVAERADDDFDIQNFDALLYRRVSGNWVYQRILFSEGRNFATDFSSFPVVIGMKGNLASVELGDPGIAIFRYNGTDWVRMGTGPGPSEDVSIESDRILYGVGESWNGEVLEPDGSGGWTSTFLPGQIRCCDDEFWGGPVDLLGDRAILGTPNTYDLEPQEIPIYQRNGPGNWQLLSKLQVPAGQFRLGAEVALHDGKAIVAARRSGPFVWSSFFGAEPDDRLQAANSYARDALTDEISKDGDLVAVQAFDPDLGTSVINLFRQDSSGKYQHVAVLKARNGAGVTNSFEIQGDTVVAGSDGKALVFELPASLTAPQSRHETFESGNGAHWTPTAGSQFQVVRPTALNGVYRQSSTAGDARAVLGNTSWVNQSIEADVRPTAFDGNDRWVGLATRYSSDQNFYYVTLRSSGTVQLKRMRNGAFTTLATAPLTVQLDRNYRLRLQSIGTQHRVYVDGQPVLTVEDTGPQIAGNAAILMYRARADYDNVIVSPAQRSTLYADDFTGSELRGDWKFTGPGQWGAASNTLAQTSVAGDARALIGTPVDDQVVALRVRPTAFAAGSPTQERWVGLIARYTDDRNYYYVTLRNSNKLSLKKVVNGAIFELGAVPASVAVGSSYALRLEATGADLRLYLNGALVIQSVDSSHAKGRGGAVTYKAAAQFDDYDAYQP
ncbi:MAG TPA: hypothetical protein VFP37_03240 [Steroidobacteraceae bacterium]|nr:hypothetical protein [Steroidobacteraceae bacterium]